MASPPTQVRFLMVLGVSIRFSYTVITCLLITPVITGRPSKKIWQSPRYLIKSTKDHYILKGSKGIHHSSPLFTTFIHNSRKWSRRQDLNLRPLAPKASVLPDWTTPRLAVPRRLELLIPAWQASVITNFTKGPVRCLGLVDVLRSPTGT